MRVKVNLSGGGILPFDYHRHLNAAMYNYKSIANRELGARLHYSREIKTFTFSEIMVPRRKVTREGIRILDEHAYLIYSSPNREYVEAVVTGMLSNPDMRVGKIHFTIEEVEVLPLPEIVWSDVDFRTLSPIVISTRGENGKKVPLYPTDPAWYVNIEKNIKHQYEKFYGVKPSGRIAIEVIHTKLKKYEFSKNNHGGAIRAVHGRFRFRGNPELIKFAYEAGVGERGAQGFGCLEVINNSKSGNQNIHKNV